MSDRRSTSRTRTSISAGVAALTTLLLVALAPIASGAPLSVDCGAGGHLQSKINSAPAGGTILVKGVCHGRFHILGKGLTLQGDPAATLNAQQTGTTLTVDAAGKTVHLIGITVTGGKAATAGGISEPNGKLVLLRSHVKGNQAVGSGGYASGGGIQMGKGSLALIRSSVTGNHATEAPGTGYAYAWGGGIDSRGPVSLSRSTVSHNSARATSVDMFAYGYGGGIEAKSVRAVDSHIDGNIASGHSDTHFSYAYGGGMDVQAASSLAASTIQGNRSSSSGYDFSFSEGAGVSGYKGVLRVDRSTVNGNHASASSSTSYAEAFGGGLFQVPGPVVMTRSTVSRNLAKATASAGDATATGGGIDVTSSLTATNSTIAFNTAEGDAPGTDTGTAQGAGAEAEGSTGKITAVNDTVSFNSTIATGGAVDRTGGGLDAGVLSLRAVIVSSNTALVGPGCYGTTSTSLGYNLIHNNSGCLGAPKSTDKLGPLPMLGGLKNNGGPTQTMALPKTSPAANAIPKPACAVKIDQRGVHRPQGMRCDIGAFEREVG